MQSLAAAHIASNRPSQTNALPDRRQILQVGACSWITLLAERLVRAADQDHKGRPAQSLILLWLDGGPSQLETFDPHPGTHIAAGTGAIQTSAPGVELAQGFERLAEQMRSAALVRSLVSKEGDHRRGMYLAQTGYRPAPPTAHPSLGAICCHCLPSAADQVLRHISILPGEGAIGAGYLGVEHDPFSTGDPRQKPRDIAAHVGAARVEKRLDASALLDQQFALGRQLPAGLGDQLLRRAGRVMASEQIAAFEIEHEPQAVRQLYGDHPFGRGCLAARRLIESGTRCVEVTLGGWDSHANNHEIHARLAKILDEALAALLADLRERQLLERTLVLCVGEFGRTPELNLLAGRDHWTHGFSALLAGGGVRAGQVIGATDPAGSTRVEKPQTFANLHATVLRALDIDPREKLVSPQGRPIQLSEGTPIEGLLASA